MTAPAGPVQFRADADGIGWIVFDAPSARANVFNPETLAAFTAAVEMAAAHLGLKALVIRSAKERIFIAGADLKWLASLSDVEAALQLSRHGQDLFQRLADFPVPVIGAIHGACAGGGYELALACHWRLATESPSTQIGLPETSIGTIPGWGGCVRLQRLIGVQPALEHILKGQLVPAGAAHKVGMVDEIVPAADLVARARDTALRFAAAGVPARKPPPARGGKYFGEVRAATAAAGGRHQPALLAAIDAVEHTQPVFVRDALPIEARYFAQVTAGPVCKNLVHVFFLREAAKKRTLEGWYDRAASATAPIKRVGVVGAGVMGSGIAQWLAVRGFEVVLRDVSPELLDRGLAVVRRLFEEGVKRGKTTAAEAGAGLGRILTTTEWHGFAQCDLVIEAIVEDVSAKQQLFTELASIVRPDAVLASNTSALPIEEIAVGVPNPGRTLGIHFFNPVSRMALVELVLARDTSVDAASRALELVKALGKSPVVCRSSPGFLVTRVLFFYLNEAVRRWEQGAAVAELDAALREFGWPMGPLRLIDEVGVDVTAFIFDELAQYFPDRFQPTTTCARMLAGGLKGRKNGESRGFYRYGGGVEAPNDGELEAFRPSGAAASAAAGAADALMSVMAAEAERCLGEGVVKSADDIDFALLTGAGFPAFRGGLMRWARGR